VHSYIWLIPALPAAAFVLISVFCLRSKRAEKAAPAIIISTLSVSLVLSIIALHGVSTGRALGEEWRVSWLSVRLASPPLLVDFGTLLDPLSAIMLVVVCAVSLAVQIYSTGYMRGDPGFARYFAFMSLFSCAMLGLVASNNLLLTYVFWELVGLCSYLLIGFWYRKPEAANAAKKAFIVTRFGDVGFLLAILALSKSAGTFNFRELEGVIASGGLKPFFIGQSAFVTVVSLLIFSGAAGKSAQFPLHIWLPDAMEGPTPVSALIHAATMVAAGVYLVARTYFFFEASPVALTVIALIGVFTAFLAASIAAAQDDIKRILAYSTISQLGYMMLGLGVGGVAVGIFHLTTHAWFKALLFLMAGSAIHAVHTNSIWEMGGLWRGMKVTAAVGLIGLLALAGLPPLSGFYSKEGILHAAATSHVLVDTVGPSGKTAVFALALAVVFLTAYYMSRLWFVAFLGKARATRGEARESPAVMTVPMIVLAVLSICAGWAGPWFMRLMRAAESHEPGPAWLPTVSVLLALAGLGVGWLRFSPARAPKERPTGGALYTFLQNHWYIDYAYHWAAWKILLGLAAVSAWVDRHIVDGMVNGVGWLAGRFAAGLRRTETGQLQFYALIIVLGALIAGVVLTGLRSAGGLLP